MIDLADLLHGLPADEALAARGRLRRNAAQVAVFALGCGIAALLYAFGRSLVLRPPAAGGTLGLRGRPRTRRGMSPRRRSPREGGEGMET